MTQERLIRLAALGAVLALPACTVTMVESSAPPPAYAPLDIANDYAWIDRADALWEAIGDGPPDYAFVFEGLEPWAWQTADGHQIVVEDAGQGGIRSYYFAPGAFSPFLVVEPGASFGFAGDVVAMVYGPDGGAQPRAAWGTRPERGRVLFARARLLKQAMARDRRGVDPDAWSDSSGLVLSFVGTWDVGRERHPGWRAHRDSAESADRRQRFARERARRRGEAGAFDRWRRGNFQGPPPPGFEPRRGPRPAQPGIAMPERPPAMPGQQRHPRIIREPAPMDPALAEPIVPAAPPQWRPRDERPARPALEERVPIAPQPVENAEPQVPPAVARSTRPERGEGRPSRAQPVEQAPEPAAAPPEPAPPPSESIPTEPQPAPPPAVQPAPEVPVVRERPARREFLDRGRPQVERSEEPVRQEAPMAEPAPPPADLSPPPMVEPPAPPPPPPVEAPPPAPPPPPPPPAEPAPEAPAETPS